MDAPINITQQDAADALTAAVAVRGGEYVYPGWENSCKYVRDGEPACLAGVVLHSLGIPLSVLEWADLQEFGGGLPAIALVRQLEDGGYATFENNVALALAQAQYKQDAGETWGFALTKALLQLDI